MCLTLGVYYILYYTLLFFCSSSSLSKSILLFSFSSSPNHSIRVGSSIYLFILSLPISSPLLLFSYSPLLIPPPLLSLSNIHSIRVGTSISLFMFLHPNPSSKNNLTPHVLSEWMVEVCGAYLCGVMF